MKKIITAFFGIAALATFAGVPIKWTVETSRADIQEIDVYHGETLDLEVQFKSYGKVLELPTNEIAMTYWQTNGMGTAYWRTNNVTIVASNGIMRSSFGSAMDVGAKTLRGFMGIAGNIYRASFVLRFKDAPGYDTTIVEWPYRLLDFSQVELRNEPWYRKAVTDEKDAAIRTELTEWTTTNVPILVDLVLTNKTGVQIGKNTKLATFGGLTVDGVAIGREAEANSLFNTAVGVNAVAGTSFYQGTYATAVGVNAEAIGQNSIALGMNAKTEQVFGTAVGGMAKAAAYEATAVGAAAEAHGTQSIAIGKGSVASNDSAIAIGETAKATGIYSAAVGLNANASGANATAVGYGAKATGTTSAAVGWNANAYGEDATALGVRAGANRDGVALGYHASAGYNSSALGSETEASGQNSVAVGPAPYQSGGEWYEGKAKAKGRYSIAVGGRVESGQNGVAIGEDALVSNNYAVVISTSEQHVTDQVNGSHGVGTITLGVKDSNPEKVYIGSKTLKKIVEENGVTTETDPTVSSWAKAASKPTYTATEVGAYPNASGTTLATQVATIGGHLNAEDARFVSTNYNSSTKMPEAYVEVKQTDSATGSNVWLNVWREMTRWNKWTGDTFDWTTWGGFVGWKTNLENSVAEKSPREYAFYDGVTGNVAPDDYFWISQPHIAVCAGAAYQRYLDGEHEIWVLESNGLVADVNGTTNGFFRITDSEGETQFEIVKGDKKTVFANANSLTQQSVSGVTHYFTTYAVTNAVAAPTAKFTASLTNQVWYADTDANCPCNVEWTAGANSYTLEWWPKTSMPSMFVKAEYERGGETYINNVAPTKMQTIMIGNKKYSIGTTTISGETVLKLTEVN